MTAELVPPEGFTVRDFPQFTVALIPYTSNPELRPDPFMTVTPEGWMFIEVGAVRIAIPDREEWDKFIDMGNRLWNTHDVEISPPQPVSPGDDTLEQERETHEHDPVDESR